MDNDKVELYKALSHIADMPCKCDVENLCPSCYARQSLNRIYGGRITPTGKRVHGLAERELMDIDYPPEYDL